MITLVMAYYENPGMLKIQYDDWISLPNRLHEQVDYIVVDDGSPRWPAKVPLPHPRFKLFRMGVDIAWNQDACRNIGVRHADTDWLLLTDIDHRIPEKTWEYLFSRSWNPTHAYYFQRVSAPDMEQYKPHPNSWLIHKKLYEQVGGYDERFAGYYGTDGDFKVRLLAAAAKYVQLHANIIRVGREVVPDASTTTYQRKLPQDNLAIKRILKERAELPSQEQRPHRFRFPYQRVI